VVFYNPPVVNHELGIRRSYLNETRRIARELLERGQQTLVFANSRLATEILLTYLKEDHAGVRGYRGGYLPKERREIERNLRDGELRAVEMRDDRFWLATLYQPELSSPPGRPHPVVAAFVDAAAAPYTS
jgi:ATP-dependent helicase YprA (DUF1998 family)